MNLSDVLNSIDNIVWGPIMLILLVGTGVFLTFKMKFLTWRNLGYALKTVFSKESRKKGTGDGDISSFSALTTALAATIGTGNIVGVATAMVSGGPGALVWMWVAALFGLTTKYAECMLAVRFRTKNENGEILGGPMFVMKLAFKNSKFWAVMAMLFAIFTTIAGFGIGCMTQANSISSALFDTFSVPNWVTGLALTIFTIIVLIGGIKSISKVSSVVVPVMAIFYVLGALIVILFNIKNVPSGVGQIISMAFSPRAAAGGVAGTITTSVLNSMRYGVARGVFSNEAGMGSAAITAAAAKTKHYVRQGYINMTGTFFDTIVICTLTGLVIACTGVLGSTDPATGQLVTGGSLTIAAFSTVFGKYGGWLVSIGIVLFAYSTILGWEYHAEKAFEYIVKTNRFNIIYRILVSVVAFIGATTTLEMVWCFADIANALMAIPNLICLLALSGFITKETQKYQSVIISEKKRKRIEKGI